MLRDAALAHLDVLLRGPPPRLHPARRDSLQHPVGRPDPVFVDVGRSSARRPALAGYRQFCQLLLYPLPLVEARKSIRFQPLLRGRLEGITPAECRALPRALVDAAPGARHARAPPRPARTRQRRPQARRTGELRDAGFSAALVEANAKRLRKLVAGLRSRPGRSEWSDYEKTSTYSDAARDAEEPVRPGGRPGGRLLDSFGASGRTTAALRG